MSISARIVVAVTFHEVDHAPDTEACTECDYECLKYAYCAVEKCHILSETNGIFYPGQLRRYPASLVSFLHSFLYLQLPMCVTRRDLFDRELWACKKHCPFVPPSDIKKALCFETEGSCPWTLFGLSTHFIRLYDRVPVLRLQGELMIQELLDVERVLLIRIGS